MRKQFAVVFALLVLSTPSVTERAPRSDDPEPLAAVVEHMSEAMNSLNMLVVSQGNRIADLEGKIRDLEAAAKRKVAFSAAVKTIDDASAGRIIPFQTVITNVGNAYNPATSVFTAPYDGDYFFIVNIDVSATYGDASVRRNNAIMFYADTDDKYVTHASGSSILSLRAGDVISVNHDESVGYVDDGTESTFTGFLVN